MHTHTLTSLDRSADEGAVAAKVQVNVLSKTRRVVVAKRLGITKCLEQGIRIEHLLLCCRFLCSSQPRNAATAAADIGEKCHYKFGRLGFACARFATDENGLVTAVAKHRSICGICNPINVRRQPVECAVKRRAVVSVHELTRVNVESPPWIDSNQNRARVCVDLLALVTNAEVVEDVGLVQKLEHHQVVRALEVSWVARHDCGLGQIKSAPLACLLLIGLLVGRVLSHDHINGLESA